MTVLSPEFSIHDVNAATRFSPHDAVEAPVQYCHSKVSNNQDIDKYLRHGTWYPVDFEVAAVTNNVVKSSVINITYK
jgi:hypothetical protein